MRRSHFLILVILAALFVSWLRAEDAGADALREKGIAALKDSQTHPRAIVAAARAFVKAEAMYVQAGSDEKSVEMNSFLYWCKKKMTMEDIDSFTKGGEGAISSKLDDVEKLAPVANDAQKWFDRADQFARKNPSEHLLIAIRFYEVADRFKGSDASLQAQDRSLKEQLRDKDMPGKSTALPTAIHAPENVASTSGSRAVPVAADLQAAEKMIQDLFKDEYKKTDASGRLALAAKLLQQADENKSDAASEYTLLHEARDQAVLGGDAAIALDAQKRLRDAFKIDFAALLKDLRKLDATARSAEAAATLATLYLLGSEDSQAVDNYDQAVRFNSRAEDLLPLIKDAGLKARLKTEIPRAIALRQASTAALAASKILTTRPDDLEANLAAGKFALERGQFETAFAMLAKSKDAVLLDIAKRELTPSPEVVDQVKLADAWFDRAEKEPLPYLKIRMQERAAIWYGNALPALTGLAKLKVETKLKALPEASKSNRPGTGLAADAIKLGEANKASAVAVTTNAVPTVKVVKVIFGVQDQQKDDTKLWQKQIEGKPFGFFYGGTVGDDPAPGQEKLLTAQILIDGQPQTYVIKEGKVLDWPWLNDGVAYAGPDGQIISAHYGARTFFDATKKMQEVAATTPEHFEVRSITDEDPSPGTIKTLVLFYTSDHHLFMKLYPEYSYIDFKKLFQHKKPEGRWVSKDATFKQSSVWGGIPDLGSNLLNGRWGGYSAGTDEMAFSTEAEDDPWIIVDLKTSYNLKAMHIVTRRSLLDRAAPMVMYRGDSEQGPWTEIWRTDERKDEYEGSLNGRGRYIKLVRTGHDYFHLYSFKIYGQ